MYILRLVRLSLVWSTQLLMMPLLMVPSSRLEPLQVLPLAIVVPPFSEKGLLRGLFGALPQHCEHVRIVGHAIMPPSCPNVPNAVSRGNTGDQEVLRVRLGGSPPVLIFSRHPHQTCQTKRRLFRTETTILFRNFTSKNGQNAKQTGELHTCVCIWYQV